MKKYWKHFAVLAVIGTVTGLIIAYFCRKRGKEDADGDSMDFTDEEDFDLDTDLQPVSEREYVPLNKAAMDVPEDTDSEEDALDESTHEQEESSEAEEATSEE